MQFISKLIKAFTLSVFAILAFLLTISVIMPFVFSGFKISVLFLALGNLFTSIFTFKISESFFEISALVLLVLIPAIIINYLSRIFPEKLNFILLPLISFPLVFLFGLIHTIFFEDSGDMEGLALALYLGTSIIFLIIFSLIISIIRLRRRNIG